MDEVITVWEGAPPGSESWTHQEVALTSVPDAPGAVRNVVVPTLTPFPPGPPAADGPARRAMVVIPGGAFFMVSMGNEGTRAGAFLAERGIAAYVLKYRTMPAPADEAGFLQAVADAFAAGIEQAVAPVLPLGVADGRRAVELVRDRGHQQVGVLGFSAGGWIAAELALADPAPGRPDLAGILYPPSVPDRPLPEGAPPLFVAAAADDPIVGVRGSFDLHRRWHQGNRPVELHVFERGGHGFGMQPTGLPTDRWPELFAGWLDLHGPGR